MVHKICMVLIMIGGLNWGLVGLGMLMGNNLNVINLIFGSMPTLEAIIYLLVGVAAIAQMFGCKCKKCMEACASCSAEGMDKGM
ncbi:DUF378 domain-containing protein [Candidatus Nomurabacteria bacterium]|nr:DUF378 domain-containing protein [Candidatus Nomurabacteria bacterium]